MARFSALLCALVAAVTSAGAVPAPLVDRAVIPGVPGPSVALFTVFTNVNYGGKDITFVDQKTTGCIEATGDFISSVSSIKLDQPDIACNLWSETNCGGTGGIVVAGDIPSLFTFGFNDKMVSFNCYSTA
ncbi:Uroporphyrin-III c-methyltransferase [Mycena venus]|uniref:Uroporphyrin-III c-methyltransferase n=1 Tax=Mycena venus TaxID=2733690 RepID=A0A8H6YWR0_9AGAR|nr:Uroporphyrin-III c-methyltransferase [Mycena venus]